MNDNEKEIKYSVIKAFMKPFWIISDNLKDFYTQGSIFSLFVVVISYLLGQKYICFFNENMAQNMYCPKLSYLYFPYLLIKLFAIAICINVWYDKVFKKEQINEEYFKKNWKKNIKTFAIFMLFMLLNLLPIVSGLILFFRKPNPIWQIELLFFTVVSVGFLAPFVLMRFYSYFASFFNGNSQNIIKKIWQKTQGYNTKISFTCIFVFLIDLILILTARGIFAKTVSFPAEIYNMLAEFVMAFVTYTIVILFVNFMEVQKQIFLDNK